LAASLATTFILYFVVSGIELISFFVYLGGDKEFARFYFSTIGYYGSIIGYAIPWILAFAHITN
jgi:hypothetical protein